MPAKENEKNLAQPEQGAESKQLPRKEELVSVKVLADKPVDGHYKDAVFKTSKGLADFWAKAKLVEIVK